MKINVVCDDKWVLPNYVNINAFSNGLPDNMKQFCTVTKDDFRNYLSKHVDDGECDEIRLWHAFCGMSLSEVPGALKLCVSKLKHGGVLSITAYDIIEIAKSTFNVNITLEELQPLLFNNGLNKCCVQLAAIEQQMMQFGLIVEAKRIYEYQFSIKGKRP